MSNKYISGLSCAEAANICHKKEYREATTRERLKLNLHLFFCTTCKDYYKRNRKLSDLLKKSKLHTCSARHKEALKQRIQEKSLETLKNQEH